ncbi:MAG: PAS domain S-box protein [Acidiphilium sp.]
MPPSELPEGLPEAVPHKHAGFRHLRHIVGGISNGVILVDPDQSIAWANARALEMHGVGSVEELGATVSDYRARFELRYRNKHPLAEGRYPMERVLAGEVFDEVVVEVAPAGNNEISWIHRIRSLVLVDDEGMPDLLVLIIDDETDRYNAEERFERAFNANPAPAIILRLDDLRHIRVNRGFLEMTGYSEEDVIGRSVYEVDVLEGAGRRELAIERLKEGRTIPQMEATLQLPAGGEKSVLLAGQPIEMGDVSCMLFTFADLDGRRQAEQALKQSEERFEIAFRLAPVPTLILLRDTWRVLLINDAFTRETLWEAEDVIGRDAEDLPLWEDAAAESILERGLKREGRVRNADFRLRTKSGESIDCLVSAEAVEIRDQSCVLLAAQNISERNRTGLELVEAIEAVMKDEGFTKAVLEKLLRKRRPLTVPAVATAGLAELPPRARTVLGLVCAGQDDAAIAGRLGLSRNTIRNHLAGLYRRTGTRSRAALIVWARERGITGAD